MKEQEKNETEPERSGAGILKNSTFILSARVLQISSSLIVFISVARYLSVEQYGDYAFIWAYVSAVMALSYFGIQQALIRAIAKNRKKAPLLIGTAIRLRLLLSAVAVLFLVVSFLFMDFPRLTVIAALIAIMAELFLSLSMLAKAVFQAFERMVYEPVLTVVSSFILLIGVTIVIVTEMGLQWFFVVAAVANATQLFLASAIMSRKFVKPVSKVDIEVLKTMFKDSFIIGFGVVCYLNLFKINVLMLKWLGDVQDVAYFQVPHSMVMQIQVVPLALITAMFPVISRLMEYEHSEVADLLEKAFKYLLIFSSFISVFLFVFSEEILLIIFGTKYMESIPALRIVAWAIIPLSLDMLLNSVLLAMNKQVNVLFYAFLTLLCNAVAAYVLVPFYGYIAAAYIAVFSYMLLLLFSFALVWRSGMHIRFFRVIMSTFSAVLVCGFVGLYVKGISLFLGVSLCVVLYFGVHIAFRTLGMQEILSLRRDKRSRGHVKEVTICRK